MTSTLKKLKNERELLISYANTLGIPANSWNDIASQLVVSEDARAVRSDGSEINVIPTACLDTDADGRKVRQLAQALLQPETSTIASRVFFAPSFAALIERWRAREYKKAPKIYKGVSYPSSLQRAKSEAIIEADNPWLIDLFAFGVQ
ncbi:hypothetical protein HY497_00870 [Candidatus Woesearchaeota archaeon]|nr:hypothetical protein [Candidatus Woesearchaeota archaeon]